MGIVPKRFRVSLTLDRRALNITGELKVGAIQGKGQESGWDKIRSTLEQLGFRITSEPIDKAEKGS